MTHPIAEYRRLIAEREARFQVMDKIRRQVPNISVEEVERDVAEVVTAIRMGREAADTTSRP